MLPLPLICFLTVSIPDRRLSVYVTVYMSISQMILFYAEVMTY